MLPDNRQVSYTENDLQTFGEDFEAGLPNQHAVALPEGAAFSPSFIAPAASLDGLAYAMYAFGNLLDYDLDEVVNSMWDVMPTVNTAYVGLANWESNHWDWYALNSNGRASIAPSAGQPLGDYIDGSGALLAAVVLIGVTPATLTEVRIGTIPPIARFTATPPGGLLPLDVTFDASASQDADGSIVKYEWDLDGDGTFELDTGTTPSAQYKYSAAGTAGVQLRVTDNIGAVGTTGAPVSAFTEWNHTWGKSLVDFYTSLRVSRSVLYAGGTANTSGNLNVNLHAYYLDGTPLWRKQWDSGDDEYLTSLAVSADGLFVYTAGYTAGAGVGENDWLIQAWDSVGSLMWTRVLGGPGQDYARAIVIAGGDLFVCGTGNFEGGADEQAIIARFTPDGDVVWQRAWGGADDDKCDTACLIPAILGSTSIGMLGQTWSYDAGAGDLLFLKFSQDGELLTALTWGDSDAQHAGGLCSSIFEGTFACGTDFKDPEAMGILLKVNSGVPGFAKDLGSGNGLTVTPILLDGSTLVFSGKRDHPEVDNDIFLGRLNLDTVELTIHDLAKTGTGDYGYALALMPGGSVLVGGTLANTTAISWQPYTGTLVDRTATQWISVAQDAVVVDAAPTIVNLAAGDATGTADTGAGDSDCYIGVHEL